MACSIPSSIWAYLGDDVNRSQYFNPIFSWFVVAYTYFAVGRNCGSIWKYLYHVTSFGLLANVVVIIKEYLYLKNIYINYVVYIIWIETYLYGLNEWGFVFINFQKIRSCIPLLKKKFWMYFLYTLLVYTMFCRTMIGYYKIDEEYVKYTNCHKNIQPDFSVTTKSTKFHAFLYIPIGIVELIFIIIVMKEYFSEKSNAIKNELSALLHSTLFRTLMVSVLYIFIAIDVLFEKKGMIDFYRKLLWRIKGMLGIIFLVDLLLLRIDLDSNTLILQKQEIDNKAKEIALYGGNFNDYEININIDSNRSQYTLSQNSSVNRPLLNNQYPYTHNYHPSLEKANPMNSIFRNQDNNGNGNVVNSGNTSPNQDYYANTSFTSANNIEREKRYNRKISF